MEFGRCKVQAFELCGLLYIMFFRGVLMLVVATVS
jgi:hypothetical protein